MNETSQKSAEVFQMSQVHSPKQSKIKLKPVIFVVILLVLLLVVGSSAVAGFYWWRENYGSESENGTEDQDSDVSLDLEESDGIDVSEEEDDSTSGEVDTSSWETYNSAEFDISFEYPSDWTVAENCEIVVDVNLCSIDATDGSYVWSLQFDPIMTGGGFGFLFDMAGASSSSEEMPLTVDGYDIVMVSKFYGVDDLQEIVPNQDWPDSGEGWGWSTSFADPDDYSTLGFGPGEMYDEVETNFWAIFYRYALDYEAVGGVDYTVLPLRGDVDLNDAFETMNAISESLGLPD
jgi:hypothetical protein